MWTLVRKDLILDRRMVGLNFVMYLTMGPVFVALLSEAPAHMIGGWAGLVSAMIPLSLVGREDKFRTAVLTCSLPVTRDRVVASRYLGGWLLSLGGGLAVLAACFGVALLGFGHPTGAWGGALPAMLVTNGLLLAGLLPFTMRFGLAGLVGFLLATQVLGMVAFLAVVLFSGDAVIRGAIVAIVGALGALEATLGSVAADLVSVAVVLLLNVASFYVSRWTYRRREL